MQGIVSWSEYAGLVMTSELPAPDDDDNREEREARMAEIMRRVQDHLDPVDRHILEADRLEGEGEPRRDQRQRID